MSELFIPYEATAEAMAKEQLERFGAWVLDESVPYADRLHRLQEIFKHNNHDAIQMGQGLKGLLSREVLTDDQAELVAEHRGYMKAINDRDEGQGA